MTFSPKTQKLFFVTRWRQVTISLLALLGLVVGCDEQPQLQSPTRQQLLIPVPPGAETITIVESTWPNTIRSQGSLAADERSMVSAKVAGRVAETLVDFGDIVTRNQPLARLEFSDFELQIQQAEAQLAEACAAIGLQPNDSVEDVDAESVPSVVVEKAIWDESVEAMRRLEKLQRTNSVSDSELNKQHALERVAKAKYDAALRRVDENRALIRSRRVAVALARQNMTDATIRAPFGGVIHQRHLAAGTYVQSGTPMFTVVRVHPLRFQGRVPERKATLVEVGKPITVQFEGTAEQIQTTVSRISPALDLASRSLEIEAEVPNADGRFRAGLFAEAQIVVDEEATTLAIPFAALGEFAGVHKVWLVQNGQLDSRVVTLGRMLRGSQEIDAGLAIGDVVLADFQLGEEARRNVGGQSAAATQERDQ